MDINREIIRLAKEYGLTNTHLAEMTGYAYDTVKAWRVKPSTKPSAKYRPAPERALKLLKFEIKDRKLKPKA